MGDVKLVDSMMLDGLIDAFHDYHMGITGTKTLMVSATNETSKYFIWKTNCILFFKKKTQDVESLILKSNFCSNC